MDGILPVYKEAGMTSHDVVFKLRKILHMKKIGHAGTLDPSVDGVLPVALGKATKTIEFLQEFCGWDKDYLWIKINSEYFADINKFYKKFNKLLL